MRIGLLFGSFNPLHNGHIAIAKECVERKLVDYVDFVVAWQNPFKNKYSVGYWDRVFMVENALREMTPNRYSVNTVEEFLSKNQSNIYTHNNIYTYNVLKHVKNNPIDKDNEFVIICGDDVYNEIHKWYKGEDILKENKFIVFTRDSKETIENDNIISYIDISGFEGYSSSKIREMISNGEDISELVPPNIRKFIHENALYYTL